MSIEEYVRGLLSVCEAKNIVEFSIEEHGEFPAFSAKFSPFPKAELQPNWLVKTEKDLEEEAANEYERSLGLEV